MRDLVADLITHKHHANAALLEAIGQNQAAAADEAVLELLHHVLIANRFWLQTVCGEPFVHEQESRRSPSFEDLAARYSRLQVEESTWLATAVTADLHQTLESPLIPGGRCSVVQAWLQVCLHSHGHRAQLAKLLARTRRPAAGHRLHLVAGDASVAAVARRRDTLTPWRRDSLTP